MSVLPRVGFAGLGAMGGALARRLETAASLTVYDIDQARTRDFAVNGSTAVEAAADLAKNVDIVLTCLPTSTDVRHLLLEGGLLDGMSAGSLLVDCTSGDPAMTREIAVMLAERDVQFVDAAVSGGPQAAEAGTIAIMAGGDELALERAEQVLRLISPNIRRMGSVGAGHVTKLLNNMLAATHRLLAFEMTAVAVANGVDARKFIEAVNMSSGRSYATEITMPRHVFGAELRQGFSLELMSKDVGLARTLLNPALRDVSITAPVAQRLESALMQFGSHADVNCLIEVVEAAVGQRIATSAREGSGAQDSSGG